MGYEEQTEDPEKVSAGQLKDSTAESLIGLCIQTYSWWFMLWMVKEVPLESFTSFSWTVGQGSSSGRRTNISMHSQHEEERPKVPCHKGWIKRGWLVREGDSGAGSVDTQSGHVISPVGDHFWSGFWFGNVNHNSRWNHKTLMQFLLQIHAIPET